MCSIKLYYSDYIVYFFFFKQKTAYEMRISDWSSDVCSSDLISDEEIKRTRESLGRRHDKPRRMHEGPQLQQIESRQVRIAKPLPHQRSVEENHRRLRRAANGLPFRHGALLAVRIAQPDAAMTCMQRRKG